MPISSEFFRKITCNRGFQFLCDFGEDLFLCLCERKNYVFVQEKKQKNRPVVAGRTSERTGRALKILTL